MAWRHCLALAAEGAGVVVNDIDATEAQEVVDEIREECRELESALPCPPTPGLLGESS